MLCEAEWLDLRSGRDVWVEVEVEVEVEEVEVSVREGFWTFVDVLDRAWLQSCCRGSTDAQAWESVTQ
jgi:hypothetical protein